MPTAVIVDIVRTASGKGKPGGALSTVHPVNLLASTMQQLLTRTGVDSSVIEDVIIGCVGQVGDQGVNIARSAVLAANFAESVPGTTIDRQCGSSQQAVHFAAQGVLAGAYDVVIAGGVESMSRVPMFSGTHGGDPLGPLSVRYPDGLVNQGVSAEIIAARWKMSRAELDDYAARSHERAATHAASGGFDTEIVPVDIATDDGHTVQHVRDETVRASTTAEGLAGLRPSFLDASVEQRFPEINWSVTPGNSSPLSDGASAALIMSEERAQALGLKPRARFHTFAVTGSDPLLMLTGVIPATELALKRSGLTIGDIDAFEVNEAFAPVPLAWQREFDVDSAKLNPRGGAIALGHPLGASGTRLLATLVNHLEATGGRYGLQTMCEGGGMANATIVEVL
ncbi:acetyl-CoA acyltransferase [Rhodococcus sp. SMB37]|uniref:thiolase family protein n=1 Tax=Rhodococcus sp. SMB37 TaxID=2512213 RepID=UPI001052EC9B|nr:thiolase family protein [Rhodococcus sp. SMB37]TCN53433.1 acetyl-CoA acyltransferase [Rhodococcus sp. SMB37]